ncbi:MAG TPA: response regulator transcription factor [Pseudonocardia sp.]|nr:response regulator transcription factor [Pseudonocardia sp.]
MVPRQRPEPFSVLVVDDQPGRRRAIVGQLRELGGAVSEAGSVAEARRRAESGGPSDLAVVDLGTPHSDGLGLIAELSSRGWKHLVVLVSVADPYTVGSTLRAGARGCLVGSASTGAPAAVGRPPTDGGTGGAAAASLAPTEAPATGDTAGTLSSREVEVLRLVADGQSNKEIGTALHLSALTIKSHLVRIGRKLGTGDRARMVALAMRAGVIR